MCYMSKVKIEITKCPEIATVHRTTPTEQFPERISKVVVKWLVHVIEYRGSHDYKVTCYGEELTCPGCQVDGDDSVHYSRCYGNHLSCYGNCSAPHQVQVPPCNRGNPRPRADQDRG